MGVQDRDWYWAEKERKEKLYYHPRSFRRARSSQPAEGERGPGLRWRVIVLALAAICAAPFAFRWYAQQTAGLISTVPNSVQESAVNAVRAAPVPVNAYAPPQLAETRRVQRLGEIRVKQASAAEAAATHEEHRRAAWAKFYQVPPKCVGAGTMECANAYIRARRAFEAKYGAG